MGDRGGGRKKGEERFGKGRFMSNVFVVAGKSACFRKFRSPSTAQLAGGRSPPPGHSQDVVQAQLYVVGVHFLANFYSSVVHNHCLQLLRLFENPMVLERWN